MILLHASEAEALRQKIDMLITLGIFVASAVFFLIETVRDERKRFNQLAALVKHGSQKEKEVAARQMIDDFLLDIRFEKEIKFLISKHMPVKWFDEVLEKIDPISKDF